MKLLPSRYIFCALRIATAMRAYGDLIPSNRSAVFWLCGWPELLGWKRRIYWLRVGYSAKKSCYYLWGIDSAGNLIIVEIRSSRGETLRDPFKSLTFHLKTHRDEHAWSTRELRAMWRDCLRSKQKTGEIASTYEHEIEEAFVRRQAAGNPPPILIVLVSSARCDFRLSDEGLKNLLFLETLAGSTRVILRAINGKFGVRGIRIRCWSPLPSASSTRSRRRRLR
jgi:hypothetical protein